MKLYNTGIIILNGVFYKKESYKTKLRMLGEIIMRVINFKALLQGGTQLSGSPIEKGFGIKIN